MKIELSKETNEEIINASKQLGFDKQEIVNRAILFYLNAIKKELDLKKEINQWDLLSDEALINFENSL